MAFDTVGAAIGGAGHDAAAIVAALITTGGIEPTVEGALAAFDDVLVGVYNSGNALKGTDAVVEQMRNAPAEAPRRSFGGGNGGGKPAGGNGTAGSLEFRSGKDGVRGRTIAQVYEDDPQYIEWAAAELKNDFMRKKCAEFLDTVAA